MASKELVRAVEQYEVYIKVNGIDEELIDAYVTAAEWAFSRTEDDVEYALKVSGRAKECVEAYIKHLTGADSWELEKYAFETQSKIPLLEELYKVLLYEARNKQVDSYFRYIEKKRLPMERFYMPRRKQFLRIGLVDALQGMIDDKYDIMCLSLVPGAGKTSIEKFFHSAVCGWYPNDGNVFYSHSGKITRMYYDGVVDIVTNGTEYTWGEIFPELRVTGLNANLEQMNIGKYKPFPSLQTATVDSRNAGKVRASRFLLVDDMIGGIEEALNKNILEKLWTKYSVDARQRKKPSIDGVECKEIHIATRWSVHDVIGRIQRMYEGNPRVKAIVVPDIDPETGKSNFDYEYGGFTVEFFKDQELLMDEISYRCLYKQEPIEREGLLYTADELRRFVSLPEREPDAIIGVCDTKDKGADFMVLVCFAQYDEDYYLIDCICDDSADFGVQIGRMSELIVRNNMQQCEFESNAGGSRLAWDVNSAVEEKGGRCNITTKATETNKETRIIVNADWVKKHCLFKDQELYSPKSDYGLLVGALLSYSVKGRNPHDDVPDAMANFCLFATRGKSRATVEAATNPFKNSGYYSGDYYDNYGGGYYGGYYGY